MNKKGAIHVDWAISMGLFLIYVVVLFILIKPGYYAEYKPENLFSIIEDNFLSNISTKIKEVQLIIEKCSGKDTTIKLEETNNNNYFSDKKFTKDDGNKLDSGVIIRGNEIIIDCYTLQPPITGSRQAFIAISYPKEHYVFNDFSHSPQYSVSCSSSSNANNCKAYLGVINDFVGFDENYLKQLIRNTPYGDISNSWGFPLNKKFNITVTKLNSQDLIEISDHSPRLLGEDVFVKEFNGIYIDKSNNRENIKVRIDVR